MIIDLVKFIHIIFALGLLGLTFFTVTIIGSKESSRILSINKNLLKISVIAVITGTLLVYPKHYTFHTLWIQAAYLFVALYAVSLRLLMVFNKNITNIWLWRSIYIILISVLIMVMHDAVTKNTILNMDLVNILTNSSRA